MLEVLPFAASPRWSKTVPLLARTMKGAIKDERFAAEVRGVAGGDPSGRLEYIEACRLRAYPPSTPTPTMDTPVNI
jgi:hypothetical protein